MGRLNPRPALIPQPERYAETRTAEPWRHAVAAPTWRLGWTKGAELTTQPYSARLLVIPHRNRVVADLTDQGALALAAPSHRVAPQVREFALALAVDDLEHLLADRHTIVGLHGTEVGANHPQVVAVRDVALRSQVGDEHIEIVANKVRIQVVDALEGFLGVLGHGGRGREPQGNLQAHQQPGLPLPPGWHAACSNQPQRCARRHAERTRVCVRLYRRSSSSSGIRRGAPRHCQAGSRPPGKPR